MCDLWYDSKDRSCIKESWSSRKFATEEVHKKFHYDDYDEGRISLHMFIFLKFHSSIPPAILYLCYCLFMVHVTQGIVPSSAK